MKTVKSRGMKETPSRWVFIVINTALLVLITYVCVVPTDCNVSFS